MEKSRNLNLAYFLKYPQRQWAAILHEREEQVFLVLTLVIGALTGLAVVAFIILTERFGLRLYLWRLCPGGHGHALRWDRSGPDDFRFDDL
jgi:hypothetical protein